jgi:Na+/H+ antiporter NhaD/arsenite permease-like protein
MPAVAVLAAAATCLLVPPDAGYLGYVDVETLGRLACMLAAVGALGRAGVFQALAARLAGRVRTARGLVGVLVGVTALASAFVTNDMALLALLPLAAAALLAVGRPDLVAPAFVLQGVAANLCGMLLPFGNPQNIYLAARFSVGFGEFVATMAGPFALSCALVAAGVALLVDGRPVGVPCEPAAVDGRKAAVLACALGVSVAAVLGAVPVAAALACVLAAVAACDLPGLLRTDWGLVVTFAAFFVFSGNLARVNAVAELFAGLLAGGAFVPAALLSQLISNVPAAVVLARFTDAWPGLLVGVNVGGAGTPVASLATLIVVGQFGACSRELGRAGGGTARFWRLLAGVNAAALAVLFAAGVALGW